MDWEVRAASLILCLGILLATIQNGIAERRIVCYHTNWSVYRPGTAKFSPQNINPYLCTHLIYAFGGFTKDNALRPFDKYQDIEKGGYAKFTGLKTYNKNLKTMLAIGGWNEGSSRFSPMVADPARRREFVKNTVKFLRQNHFDGLDLDWEYPAFRDGGKPRDKDNYANLVQELREEFERESSKTGRPRLLLSMAMPAGVEYIDKGYDVPRLNEYLDFVNLLSYDYHSAYEPVVNHHSPLYPLEEDNEYNYDAELTIDYTINHLLKKGASADKIVLGIPTYGRSYTLFNRDATELGSPADGPGVEGDATREKGYLAYYEICESITGSDEWQVVQPNPKAMGPYAFKGDQWVGYDDENIVKLKARYVNEKKLGGIMFWSIDNDDFRGKCHGRPYPLIEAAKEALLTDNSRNTIDKPKSVDSRKKTRTQSAQSNAFKSNNRRSSTTSAPIVIKRASSPRPKYRNISRPKASDEERDEDREGSKKSDDDSDEDIEGRNTVRVTEKTERPKDRNRSSKTRSGSTDRSSRRKQSRRKGQTRNDENEEQESLSNKLTTPEPPTTPDPGTDFKCEDEGFFPHPRDCKKYFWCLDSGPGGLGVVAHQFTCPSGLVFNKAADSCDYPRNVICPKASKTSVVSTTKSPITAATSRTTYLHSTTTAKPESEEYDSAEDYEDETEEDEEEEEEVREEPTTTAKPLVYKTLTRNRPSTTTTTTTIKTSKPNESNERISDSEDEEDPKVIKELIDLIKKAGGIEQLEKQLLFQDKNADTTSGSKNVTPATISRSLYERVLNRQASKIASQQPVFSSSEISYVNGPGRAQFEGLDEIPEVKNLRQKHQYVTIERSRSPAKEEEEEEEKEEEEEEDNTDVASSEDESVSHPEDGTSTHRATPSYVNIRRTRPSTTTSRIENDVVEKEVEEEKSTRRRRPFISSKQQDNEANSETSKSSRNRGSRISEKKNNPEDVDQAAEKDDSSQTTKSRYTSIQRFRSTTSKTSDESSSVGPLTEAISETTLPTRLEEYSEISSTTAGTAMTSSSTTPATTTSTSTEVITVISVEPSQNPSSVNPKTTIGSTTDSVKLVDDSATEILLTTVPATVTSSSPSTTTTTMTTTTTTTTTASTLGSRSTIAVVSQPRPFGFTRRRSGSSETTTTIPPSSKSKVAETKTIRLPTLKELIGYSTTYHDDRIVTTPSSSVISHLLRDQVDNDISLQNVEETARASEETVGDVSWLRQASKNKARSRIPKMADVIFDKKALAANAIHEDENKRRNSSTSVYLKPTTMRGIPLADLTPSPMIRGFYVTKSEDDSTTRSVIDLALQYTDNPVESQTESTPATDIPVTTNEIVTRAYDQNEADTLDNNENDATTDEVTTVAYENRNESEINTSISPVSDEDNITREEKLFVSSSSTIASKDSGSVENLLDREEPNIPDNRSVSRRRKLSRELTYNETPNVVSTRSSTRRKIALAVNRYNEATPAIWTGRRIVARKRHRTTVSPIKDAISRTESEFAHSTTSIFESATSTTPSTLTLSRAFSAITTRVPLNTLEVTISPESSNIYKKRAKSFDAEIEDPNNHAIVAEAVTSTPKIDSTANPTAAVISTISDDFTVVNTRTSEVATATSPTVAIAKVPSLKNDATTTIATTSSNVETTFTTASNYLSDIPATTSTHANDFVTANNENESNSTTTSYLTDFTNVIETISSVANYSEITTSVNTIATDSSITITNTEFETTFTSSNYPSDTAVSMSEVETTFTKSPVTDVIPATANTNAITTDFSTSETAEDETAYTNAIANYSTVVTAAIAEYINKNETDSAIATTNAETEAISTGTTNNFESVTFTNVHATTIPDTTLQPLRTVSSDADTHTYPTAYMTTSNFIDTLTTNMMTATADTIVPITTDSSVITTSANTDIPSTIIDTVTATTQSRTDSVTSTYPVTDTPLTSSISTTAKVESNIHDIRINSEILADIVTEQSTQNTPTLTSKFSSSTIFETLLEGTTAFSSQTDENSVTPMITRTSSTLPSLVTPVTTTVVLKKSKSTDFLISATSYELTPTTIRTTESIYPSRFTTREESTKIKTDFPKEKATFGNDTQNKTNAQTATISYESNFKQKTSKDSTILEKNFSEETTSESTRNREQNQNQTTSARNGQKTSRRRVINRTNNWNGWSVPQQTSHQYPRRVPLHRGTRRPSSHISSARTREENLRRRIAQKRARINPEAIGSTVGSDENIVDVQNTTEKSVTYDQNRRTKVGLTKVRERIDEKETTTSQGTTVLPQPSNSIENKSFRDHNENVRRDRKPKRVKPQTQEDLVAEEIRGYSNLNNIIANNNKNLNNNNNNSNNTFTNTTVTNSITALDNNLTTIDTATDENQPNISENNFHTNRNRNRFQQDKINRRMRIVLKNVRPISKEENSTAEASAVSDSFNNTRGSFSSRSNRRGRMRVVLKSIRPKEETSTIEEAELDFANENGRENLLNNRNASVNFTVENKTERIMRVVKRVRSKSEETETRTTTDEVDANSAASPRDVTLNDLRNGTNLFVEFGRRNGRRMKIVLKSVKPRLEETRTDSDSTDEDLRGSSSNNPYVYENRSDEEKKVVSKKTEPARKDLITEETGDSPITFVSVLPPGFRENRKQKTRNGTNVLSKERAKPKSREEKEETEKINAIDKNHESNISSIRSKSEKEQATTEPQEDARTTEAITVLTEEDTDRFSLETTSLRNNGSSLNRNSGSGSNPVRQRKPTQPTTVSPLISTVPSYLTTTHRRVRPAIETTLSPRIDLNVFDGVSESYVKSVAVENDQKTDVSDQSVRAQEFAATLADPPISSSPDTGRTPLVDVDGRKISTTITPRTYFTTERTVTRYVADVRGRQKFRTKDNKPATANATTRPRRPPVIDYDYYEDEVPIVIGKSFLNSKLFLTSKGTIRCLDQGNFPHPYSCKKFITCARMVNGQVIGTEYTCPDKLSFDPIGGICNWSAGLGCKER